jgi:transcriptional regulator with XRE-family HTH domain
MVVTRPSEPDPIDKYVGARIRMRRIMLRMSQTKLGGAAGVTFQQVQKYEKGTNRVSASRLHQFAKILDVSVSFFFEGAPTAKVVGSKSSGNRVATPAHVLDFLTSRDGQSIIKTFSRIADRELRRRVVDLVKQIVDGRGHRAY